MVQIFQRESIFCNNMQGFQSILPYARKVRTEWVSVLAYKLRPKLPLSVPTGSDELLIRADIPSLDLSDLPKQTSFQLDTVVTNCAG